MSAREVLDRQLLDLASRGERPRCGEPADHDLWVSDSPEDRRRAANLCTRCPILPACAAAAEEHDERHHVWGAQDRGSRR